MSPSPAARRRARYRIPPMWWPSCAATETLWSARLTSSPLCGARDGPEDAPLGAFRLGPDAGQLLHQRGVGTHAARVGFGGHRSPARMVAVVPAAHRTHCGILPALVARR